MSERRGNVFRLRRLKWGDPERLEGIKAIGLDADPPRRARRRVPDAAALGLIVAGVAAGFAIGMGLLGGF